MGLLEPDLPRDKRDKKYEKWASYWYAKFDDEHKGAQLNVEYMHQRRMYMQRRWEDALRKLNGVQRHDNMPDFET